MKHYPIALAEYGDWPHDEEDFRGFFRIGYSEWENALYIAVEVQDESTVIDTSAQAATWDAQDGCEVYVGLEHLEEKGPAGQFALYGDHRRVYGSVFDLRNMEVAVRREEGVHVYEWRVDIARRLTAIWLGFDLVVCDRDQDGTFSWMAWAPGTSKVGRAQQRGDLLLEGGAVAFGKLWGKVKWADIGGEVAGARVRILSSDSETLWLGMTGQQGGFELDLPVGQYRVEAWSGRGRKSADLVDIHKGGFAELLLTIFEAGTGRWVATGNFAEPADEAGFSTVLANLYISCVFEDREGNWWFGSTRGAYRYDGARMTTFAKEDGLAGNHVQVIAQDREGHLWFGMRDGGASRYDGRRFATFTPEDGLAGNSVRAILEDREGNLWFGSWNGASRYDGRHFTPFRSGGNVSAILEDDQGRLWFATWGGGVSRYDGDEVATFTTEDGLASNWVNSIAGDGEGRLWFSTLYGASRYDGKTFTSFTSEDGLASDRITALLRDSRGHLWFGTWDRGVSRYDGLVFQHYSRREGLVDNAVLQLFEGKDGAIWIATERGISRYRSRSGTPSVRLVDVAVDRRLGPVERLRTAAPLMSVAFEFESDAPGAVYAHRLHGYEETWRTTRAGQAEYSQLARGDYTFQVRAVDRDLNYSPPVEVELTVHLPYATLGLVAGLALTLTGLVLASGYAVRQRRERNRAREILMREMEEELETAHRMQMSLMPQRPPHIAGLDVAGRCLPANHVGGDFFQYYLGERGLAVCMADVTGHAMEAAIPAVMFSGLLHSEMQRGAALAELFGHLNRTLHERLAARTFVCFVLAECDPASRRGRLCSAGCPPLYHYRAATGQVSELAAEAYPLGIRPAATYQAVEFQLEPGDRLVFCSDGIIEAENAAGELFGFERTAAAIGRVLARNPGVEEALAGIVTAVEEFTGEVPAGDDRTCIVVGVE